MFYSLVYFNYLMDLAGGYMPNGTLTRPEGDIMNTTVIVFP